VTGLSTLEFAKSAAHRHTPAEYRRYVYLSNGWGRMQRWDGTSTTLEDAGISPPSPTAGDWAPAPTEAAGDCVVGTHVVRYRYKDSRTGYVSDPSNEAEIVVTSTNGELTFPISTTTATNMIRSLDSKVDKIVLEMSVVGQTGTAGAQFFVAAEGLQSAATLVVDLSDDVLTQKLLPYDSDGHRVPPVAKHVLSHADHLWLFGQVQHSTGTADFTNGSSDVDEATDPDWRTDVLGTSTVRPDVTWLIRRSGDVAVYEVDYYDSGNSKIVLKDTYGGVSGTGLGYTLFSVSNDIWVSRPNYPESFIVESRLSGPSSEHAGEITGAIGYGNSVLVFTERASFKILWDRGPTVDAGIFPVAAGRGAIGQRVIQQVEGVVYVMDRLGIYAFNGTQEVEHLSRAVEDVFQDQIDFALAAKFSSVYMPKLRAIRWYVQFLEDELLYPQRYLQLDLDTQTWGTGKHQQGVADVALVPTEDGLAPIMSDDQGHVWFLDRGNSDGCSDETSHPVATSGSTTTVVQFSTVLPTTGAGYDGCYLYDPEQEEYRRITANTSSEITVATAFTVPPADGDTLWVGAFESELKSKAYIAPRSVGHKRRGAYYWLGYHPTESSRDVEVRAFEDYSTTSKTWTANRNDLTGLTWPVLASDPWKADSSYSQGSVGIPVGSNWKRALELQVKVIEPDCPLEIFSLELDGESRREAG